MKLLEDPCCGICKSNMGICLSKGKCEHHVEARKRQDANDRARQTVRRPTEDQAITNIMRATRNHKKEER